MQTWRPPPPRPVLPDLGTLGPTWWVGASIYVAIVGGLAGVGDTRAAWPLVVAAVLTLPSGLPALALAYATYVILLGAASVVGAHVMDGNGWGPTWFVVVDEIVVVGIFAVAAAANAFLLADSPSAWRSGGDGATEASVSRARASGAVRARQGRRSPGAPDCRVTDRIT